MKYIRAWTQKHSSLLSLHNAGCTFASHQNMLYHAQARQRISLYIHGEMARRVMARGGLGDGNGDDEDSGATGEDALGSITVRQQPQLDNR